MNKFHTDDLRFDDLSSRRVSIKDSEYLEYSAGKMLVALQVKYCTIRISGAEFKQIDAPSMCVRTRKNEIRVTHMSTSPWILITYRFVNMGKHKVVICIDIRHGSFFQT